MERQQPSVAIVDYALGNLFSVRQACAAVGLPAQITSEPGVVANADAVILPGVGAFGDAMENLRRLNMDSAIREFADSGKPLVGICLGMQLLMDESSEFGWHKGLGLIAGDVVRLEVPHSNGRILKVPQIGWNRILPVNGSWGGTMLEGLKGGEYMYFVHSYCVRPVDVGLVISTTVYGEKEFCSTLQSGNIFACQYHPERSGEDGLRIYRALVAKCESVKV
jgi:glutamine amidotransferase